MLIQPRKVTDNGEDLGAKDPATSTTITATTAAISMYVTICNRNLGLVK
jgi:hypothetical protein